MRYSTYHPSGVAEPSDTDIRLTRKLIDALALIDVRILDNLIIGQGVQTSLAERGLIEIRNNILYHYDDVHSVHSYSRP
ncbi:MAG: JAB domain-containing protein [Granulosicoccus sp.]